MIETVCIELKFKHIYMRFYDHNLEEIIHTKNQDFLSNNTKNISKIKK